MSTLDSKDFGLKIYNKFPPKYREDDASQSYALQRFLESLSDGGFSHIIDDTNNLISLVNPNTVESKFLPILYKQFGLEISNEIPENYLRYLLPKLGVAWSQKGTLSILEFITTSLSGVKVSSELSYDENGDPLITVFLEMDYNIGDYFPDAEQFLKLLNMFLPFYVDKNLVYSYVFYDSQVVRMFEPYSKDLIYDNRKEEVSFKAKNSGNIEVENYKESLILTHNIVAKIRKEFNDGHLNNIKTSVKEDSIRLRLLDEETFSKGDISLTYNESVSVYRRGGKKLEDISIFGEAVFGKGIFNKDGDYSDITEDKITFIPTNTSPTLEDDYHSTLERGVILSTFKYTKTNSMDNTLNENFYTNTISGICVDIITMPNGEKSHIIHY